MGELSLAYRHRREIKITKHTFSVAYLKERMSRNKPSTGKQIKSIAMISRTDSGLRVAHVLTK